MSPLASDRYLLKITLSAEARARLDRARDLPRHVVPTGGPAVIVDRALTVLVERLETARCGAARRPQARPSVTTTRHAPASVRRAVWVRDEGRAHNAYEAEREFGAPGPVGSGRTPRATATLSGQSSAAEAST